MLVITKTHWQNKSVWLNTELQVMWGRNQSIKIKHESPKESTLNISNAGTEDPVYLSKTEASPHPTTALVFKMTAIEVSRKTELYLMYSVEKGIPANPSRPRGSSIDAAHQEPWVAFFKKRMENLIRARHSHVHVLCSEPLAVGYLSSKHSLNERRSGRTNFRGEFTEC